MKVKKVMKEVTLCGETQDQDHELTRSLDTQPFFTTVKEQDLHISVLCSTSKYRQNLKI